MVINSVNGKEFKANEVYAVVTNNFCAAGGDTYYAFKALPPSSTPVFLWTRL